MRWLVVAAEMGVEQQARGSGRFAGELLIAPLDDHARPVRKADDMVDLEADVAIPPHHAELQPFI
jgi:hypothetical protein